MSVGVALQKFKQKHVHAEPPDYPDGLLDGVQAWLSFSGVHLVDSTTDWAEDWRTELTWQLRRQ